MTVVRAKMTIQSRDGNHRATLIEREHGVEIRFWEPSGWQDMREADKPARVWKQTNVEIVDAPWHLVCDRIHRLIGGE